MALELEESSLDNFSGKIPGDIEMFDDSSLLIENSTMPEAFQPSTSDNEYKPDPTMPLGWSGRGVGSSLRIRSPAGETFRSRRAAFEEMIISGKYQDAEIEAMRDSLIHEGWEDSTDIPDGWKIKKRTYGTLLMEQGGRMFESSIKAHGFINKYRKYYSNEDYQKILNLSNPKGHQKRIYTNSKPQDSQDYSEQNGSSLIENISTDVTEVVEKEPLSFLDSQTFIQHQSGESHYPEHNLPFVNNSLSLDLEQQTVQNPAENQSLPKKERKPKKEATASTDWKEDEALYPPGWKFSVINQPNKEPFSKYLSPSGSHISGIRGALCYMVTNRYPEEEIEMMRRAMLKHNWQQHHGLPEKWLFRKQSNNISFCDPFGRFFKSKDKAMNFLSNDSYADVAHIRMLQRFQAPSLLNIENDDSWKENEEVYPPGWKCKVIQLPTGSGGGGGKYEKVMSPSGELFKCRRAVLSHMITHQFSSEDIQKLQSVVEKSGWHTSEFLPVAWTYKRKAGSGIEFSNEEGKCLGSKEKTLKWLSKNSKRYQNEIQMVETFFKQKTDSRHVELIQKKSEADQQMNVDGDLQNMQSLMSHNNLTINLL